MKLSGKNAYNLRLSVALLVFWPMLFLLACMHLLGIDINRYPNLLMWAIIGGCIIGFGLFWKR